MRNRLLILTVFFTLTCRNSFAQIVGADVFLQGKYLEIGEQSDGALGANTSPLTYHAHTCCGSPVATPGDALAEVYDYGHDGWTVGAPAFMGDYTYPGSPFEGWEVQMNGARMQCYQGPSVNFNPIGGTLTGGSITSYTNAGGIIKANWTGTFNYGGSSLLINQETRVDTLASAVVFTVTMHNTSLAAIPGVYYWRSCDPDNDQTWPGGSFTTNNVVNIQNATIPNPTHKVAVTASGTSTTLPPLTLCTKDCRAVACIYDSWGLTVTEDLANAWSMSPTLGFGGAFYDVGTNHPGDIAIGLVYNIGTIAAGDSAVISYSYVFNGVAGIDDPGALPDPVLTIDGTAITTYPDTLNGCLYPGIDSLPVDILYGDDKDWTWGLWTWTPSTGLTTTLGVHNFVHLNAIPGNITYTITGTDSGAHMKSCQTKQFIFTVHSCHLAYGNNPCFGDAIRLGMLGDSLGATYFWYGPAGFTSTLHNPVRSPATFADTGVYHVIRTIGGVNDTDFVHVIVHPLPVVTAMSSITLCGRFNNPETLGVNLDSAGETFGWTGPNGFTSTAQFPTIPAFDSTDAGTYFVTGTSVWGCQSSASVTVFPGIVPGFSYLIHRGCDFDTVDFFNTSYNADTYDWDFNDATAHVYTRNTTHVYVAQKSTIYSVKLLLHNSHGCVADTTIQLDITHDVEALFKATPDTLCLGTDALVTFNDLSFAKDSSATLTPASYAWNFGDGATSDSASPIHVYTAAGRYHVTLEVTDGIPCKSPVSHDVFVVKIDVSSLHDTLLCLAQPLALNNIVTTTPPDITNLKYSWTESSPNLDDPNVKVPHVSGFGDFTDILTITAPGVVPDGCPVSDTIVIHAVKGRVLTNVTGSATINYGSSIQLNSGDQVFYWWKPDDGSLSNPNINNPIATPAHTTVYTVYGLDVNGCLDSAYVTVFVDSTTTQGLPSGFTPNGDGVNDVFRPLGSRFDKMVEFRVYNRWGEEMFATNRKDQGWDGTYHGIPQDMGVYYYQVIVATPGGANIVYKGSVTLIR